MENDQRLTYVLSLTPEEKAGLLDVLKKHTESSKLDHAISELEHAYPKDGDELASYGHDIIRREYYDSVRSYADDIIQCLKDGEFGDEEDDARESIQERLSETADSSQWVIYALKTMDVLRYSDNDSAYVDEYGSEGIVEDGNINWSRLAYAAFEADISEIVWPDFENWKDEVKANRDELDTVSLDPSDVEYKKLADGTYLVHVPNSNNYIDPKDGRGKDWTIVLDERGAMLRYDVWEPEGKSSTSVLLLPERIVSGITSAWLETSESEPEEETEEPKTEEEGA